MLAVAETPKVSVVMPVHNAMPYLDIAVESILGQTLQNFEFVILDDASTDGSTERLREWASRDPRIRLIEEKTNLGPALSSERVAREARAPSSRGWMPTTSAIESASKRNWRFSSRLLKSGWSPAFVISSTRKIARFAGRRDGGWRDALRWCHSPMAR